jgi:hypothetical protein
MKYRSPHKSSAFALASLAAAHFPVNAQAHDAAPDEAPVADGAGTGASVDAGAATKASPVTKSPPASAGLPPQTGFGPRVGPYYLLRFNETAALERSAGAADQWP